MAEKYSALDLNPWWCVALVVVAGVAVYANSLSGAFVFDDLHHIIEKDVIHDLGQLDEILGTRRPLVYLSLAINWAIGGEETFGYHVYNIFVHVLASLVLFDLVRRLLLRFPKYEHASGRLALIATLFWTVHPLQTESVSYTIQRGESMMALFYLLMLYALLRGASVKSGTKWNIAAIVACACGLASKGVMVSAPFVALVFDYAFLARTPSEILRKRAWVHGGILIATVGTLFVTGVMGGTFRTDAPKTTAGFGLRTHSSMEYLQSQPYAILTYLRLSFWPTGQCLDYEAEVVEKYSEWLPQGLVILALLAATVFAFTKSAALGFIGAFFFLVLGPTSSFVPINDIVFEHRMYLPLAAVTVLATLAGHTALRKIGSKRSTPIRYLTGRWWIATGLVVVAVVGLGTATILRNRAYQTNEAMWRDVLAKRPDNARAMVNLGFMLASEQEDYPAAYELLKRANELKPDYGKARRHFGQVLIELGSRSPNPEERKRLFQHALRNLQKAEQISPGEMEVHYLKGCVLSLLGRNQKALAAFDKCFALHAERPRSWDVERIPKIHLNRGRTYGNLGEQVLAEKDFRAALALDPSDYDTRESLIVALGSQRKWGDEFMKLARELVSEKPDAYYPRMQLFIMYKQQRNLPEAERVLREMLQHLHPQHPNRPHLEQQLRNIRNRGQ